MRDGLYENDPRIILLFACDRAYGEDHQSYASVIEIFFFDLLMGLV